MRSHTVPRELRMGSIFLRGYGSKLRKFSQIASALDEPESAAQ